MVFQQYVRSSTKIVWRDYWVGKNKSNIEIHQTTTPIYMQTKTISSESSLTKSSCATAWEAPASEYTPHEKNLHAGHSN